MVYHLLAAKYNVCNKVLPTAKLLVISFFSYTEAVGDVTRDRALAGPLECLYLACILILRGGIPRQLLCFLFTTIINILQI
jgi:hypothetical protein